jgi:AraC-like DNA-binding protein
MLDQIANLFSIVVGFIGFLVVLFMLLSNKSNVLINGYLIIVFLFSSIRLVHQGFLRLDNFDVADAGFGVLTPLSLFAIPCIFLYLKSLFKDVPYFSAPSLLHFTFPALNVLFTIMQNYFIILKSQELVIIQIISIVVYIVYHTELILTLIYKNINKDITAESPNSQHVRLIKRWTLFFGTVIFILAIRMVFAIVSEFIDPSINRIIGYNYSLLTSFVWLVMFSIILFNPEILHGYPNLKSRVLQPVQEPFPVSNIWNETELSNQDQNLQDSKLGISIGDKTSAYVSEIEDYVSANHPFRNSKYSIKDLAEALKTPVSHLSYIFKYHCKMPFVEYKNYARITDALHLIAAGFLAHKTLEALSIKVGFTSYNPFYTSFKKQTGQAPKDFLLNHTLKTN